MPQSELKIKRALFLFSPKSMELSYRMGGFKGAEIREMMGVDYSSTVSQGRRRLKEKLAKDKNFSLLMERIERRLSRIKI